MGWDKKKIEIYSGKYDLHGVIEDYGVVSNLIFTHNGKEVSMSISLSPLSKEQPEEIGRKLMESYVEKMAPHNERNLQLHYWFIKKVGDGIVANGIVTGHKKLADATYIHTSAIQTFWIDEDELVIKTYNSTYYCPLEYCRFDEQDLYSDVIPDYERIKAKYKDAIKYPSIEKGKVLLVLADFAKYYFHSLYYVPEDSADDTKIEYRSWPHVGTFQDSFLIRSAYGHIDLRYFPHFQNIEFYSEKTTNRPLYIENIGSSVLYAKTHAGTIKLDPGDRKEVIEENTEKENTILPDGDLYPAGIIEE